MRLVALWCNDHDYVFHRDLLNKPEPRGNGIEATN